MAWRRLGYIRFSASTSSSLPRHGKAWLSHLLHVSLSQVALTANHGLYFFHKFNAYPHSIIRYNIHTGHVMLFWKNRKQNYYRQLFAKCHTKYKPLSVVVLAMRSIQGPYLLNPTTNHHQIAHSLESAIYGSRVIHSPRNLTSLSAAPNAIKFQDDALMWRLISRLRDSARSYDKAVYSVYSLQWRHGHDHHQPCDCLLNGLFRHRSKTTSKPRVTGLCAGNSPVIGEFPHKGPGTRKIFSFDDVIMYKPAPDMPISIGQDQEL